VALSLGEMRAEANPCRRGQTGAPSFYVYKQLIMITSHRLILLADGGLRNAQKFLASQQKLCKNLVSLALLMPQEFWLSLRLARVSSTLLLRSGLSATRYELRFFYPFFGHVDALSRFRIAV
jgi:hypothetical protein